MTTYAEKLRDPNIAGRAGIYSIRIGSGQYIGSAILLPKRLRQHMNGLLSNKNVTPIPGLHLTIKRQDFDLNTPVGRSEYQRAWRAKRSQKTAP